MVMRMSTKKKWSIKNFESSDFQIGMAFLVFFMMIVVVLTNNPTVSGFEGMVLVMMFIIGSMIFFVGIGIYQLISIRLKKR